MEKNCGTPKTEHQTGATSAEVNAVLWEALHHRNQLEFLAYRLGQLVPELDAEFCRGVVRGEISFRPLVPMKGQPE